MLATAGVALVDPQVGDARKLLVSAVEQQRHGRTILNICRVHLGSKDEATSIDENVAFAAVDTLGTIVAADAADASGSNRLAIDDARARLRVASHVCAELVAQDSVEVLPGAIQAPPTEIVIRSLPGWEFMRQQSPGAAASHDIEDRIQDFADRMEPGPTQAFGRWEKRVKAGKLSVREVGQVGSP